MPYTLCLAVDLKQLFRWQEFAFAQYSFAVSVENFLNLAITPVTTTLYNYFCREERPEAHKDAYNYLCYLYAYGIAEKEEKEKMEELLLNFMKEDDFHIQERMEEEPIKVERQMDKFKMRG